jgi:hypothetical protein
MSENLSQLIMQMLTGQADSSAGAGLQDMLSKMDTSDPRMALFAQYMKQRQEETARVASARADVESEWTEDERPQARAEEKAQAISQLRQEVSRMYGELEDLRAQNDRLAAALGACYLCWGADLACQVCGGSGQPGASPPDRKLFGELVIPAVRRLYQSQSVDKNFSQNIEPRVSTGRTPITKGANHEWERTI